MNVIETAGHDFVYCFRAEDQFKGKIKGRSLIGFPTNYCIIDLETTGLDSHRDSIIEIAAIKVKNDVIVDTFSSLIKPQKIDTGNNKYYVDDFISSLTGITNQMLEIAPDGKEILAQFKNFVGNTVVLGYSVNFDISFLYHNCEDYFRNDFIDVLRLVRFLLPDIEPRTLANVASHFNIDTQNSHRALKDCQTTKLCYDELKKIMLKEYEDAECFIKNRVNRRSPKTEGRIYTPPVKAKNIISKETNPDEDNPLFGLRCVFTGTLERMHRIEAMQIVANMGGINQDTITKKTNLLILGNQNYNTIKDGKSSKQKQAEKLILKGADLKIISENTFYAMIDPKD